MGFLKEPTAKRQLLQKFSGLVYGETIVVHLSDFMAAFRRLMTSVVSLEFQNFTQSCLRAFNAAGLKRLPELTKERAKGWHWEWR